MNEGLSINHTIKPVTVHLSAFAHPSPLAGGEISKPAQYMWGMTLPCALAFCFDAYMV